MKMKVLFLVLVVLSTMYHRHSTFTNVAKCFVYNVKHKNNLCMIGQIHQHCNIHSVMSRKKHYRLKPNHTAFRNQKNSFITLCWLYHTVVMGITLHEDYPNIHILNFKYTPRNLTYT